VCWRPHWVVQFHPLLGGGVMHGLVENHNAAGAQPERGQELESIMRQPRPGRSSLSSPVLTDRCLEDWRTRNGVATSTSQSIINEFLTLTRAENKSQANLEVALGARGANRRSSLRRQVMLRDPLGASLVTAHHPCDAASRSCSSRATDLTQGGIQEAQGTITRHLTAPSK
jgi:hypothetical protein